VDVVILQMIFIAQGQSSRSERLNPRPYIKILQKIDQRVSCLMSFLVWLDIW